MRQILNLFIFILVYFSVIAEARQPAIEPVMGLSIDEFEEKVPKAKEINGFNFQQRNTASTNSENFIPKTQTKSPPNLALIKQTDNFDQGWGSTVVLIGLLTLPFFLWHFIMKGLNEAEEATKFTKTNYLGEEIDNTYSLSDEREKRKEKGNNVPKAS